MSGVICDKRLSVRVKGESYNAMVRLEILYGLEMVPLTKRQEPQLESADLKMLILSLRVTRNNRVRNDYIRGTAKNVRLTRKSKRGKT